MEYIKEESKKGHYDVYQHENGKKYFVLKDLSPNDIHTPGVLEQFMHQHYARLEIGYWLLFLATFVYLFVVYILLPLKARFLPK